MHFSVDWIFKAANAVFLASLGVGVIASWTIYKTADIKEDRANERITELKNDTAQANKRTAELEKEAEELRLQLAWREVTREQVDTLKKTASSDRHDLNIRFISGDPESQVYAMQIGQAFLDAGWKVYLAGFMSYDTLPFGTFISDDSANQDAVVATRKVFKAVDLPFTTDNLSGAGILMGMVPNTQPSNQVATVTIGINRKPPFLQSTPPH